MPQVDFDRVEEPVASFQKVHPKMVNAAPGSQLLANSYHDADKLVCELGIARKGAAQKRVAIEHLVM